MSFLKKRASNNGKIKAGPIYSKDGIPYDYIVIFDSGSKGSRVYVYNWLNPAHALEKGYDLKNLNSKDVKLIEKYDISDSDEESEVESESESDSETNHQNIRLPHINTKKNWNRKIKPGISTFIDSPQKIGKRHLKHLLNLASNVVPKSQHYRTPIFLHSTGGMRLLKHMDQEIILDSICNYFTTNSDFYLPDCASHINIIDGDVEGLYGWLSINYLVGSFDYPLEHEHGKNHTTYGLLDMGGASTQVVFSPNSSEIQEHENNLYRIKLTSLPKVEHNGSNVAFEVPTSIEYSIYSDSFLGFGMYQAYNRYLSYLIEAYKSEHNPNNESNHLRISNPIPDPCLPKGYTTKFVDKGVSSDFTGSSNFEQCLNAIFPVLLNSTYVTGLENANSNCKQFSEGDEVSSCLFYDKIPSFDFDINHFFGVSGYENAITNLLAYDSTTDDNSASKTDNSGITSDEQGEKYDYKKIYEKNSKLCSQSFSDLIELNNKKPENQKLSEEDLAELCFKSSWILNFLHLGLGFPRFGIDETDQELEKFESLKLVENIGGAKFSWTLGRALLYANDEYAQAFVNYTKLHNFSDEDRIFERPGFYYTASSGVYNFGAEISGIKPRPLFTKPEENANYKYYDYEYNTDINLNELKWYIQPHRWNGIFIYMILFCFIIWLMVGKNTRSELFGKAKSTLKKIYRSSCDKLGIKNGNTYNHLSNGSEITVDLESNNYELEEVHGNNQYINSNNNNNDGNEFKIDSDEE